MRSAAHKSTSTANGSAKAERTSVQTRKADSIPVWTGPELIRIAPGQYTAVAVRIIGPAYLRQWLRYSVAICFRPLSEPEAELVLFLNLGNMKPTRGSHFFRAWTQANGGPPMKGQKMDLDVFLEGQIYEIKVIDADSDSDGNRKSTAEIYSKVKRIVSVQRRDCTPSVVVPFSRK
jgi:hypothetical protein